MNWSKCGLVFFLLILANVTFAQNTSNLPTEQLWIDGIHYLKIGQLDYAKAYLQAYLNRKPNPVKTLELSEKDPRAGQILIQLQNHPKLGKIAKQLLSLINKGWELRRKDINRIKKEIERLKGSSRAQFYATQRLKESGEYAVPLIIEYFKNPKESALHPILIDVLVEIGLPAVEPLLASLPTLPQQPKLLVIEALAKLNFPQAVPYLKALIESSKTSVVVREKAKSAIEMIYATNPKCRSDDSASMSFYKLALLYYQHDSAVKPASNVRLMGLAPDIRADKPNIWVVKNGKLTYIPVAWDIYYEIMTMRIAGKALSLDKSSGPKEALTLWLAANCKRELTIRNKKLTDPIHKNNFPNAQYFFTASGVDYCLDVLAKALKEKDTLLAIETLKALRKISSNNNILKPIGGLQPIVNALTGKDEKIKAYSAITLSWAKPTERYPGDTNVADVLAGIIAGKYKLSNQKELALQAAIGLERLADTKLKQYNVDKKQIRSTLAKAIAGNDWNLAYQSARVLSKLPSAEAQQLLVDSALSTKNIKQKAELLNLATISAKLNGNKLKATQISTLQKLATQTTKSDLRTALADLLGALNLPPITAKQIILNKQVLK